MDLLQSFTNNVLPLSLILRWKCHAETFEKGLIATRVVELGYHKETQHPVAQFLESISMRSRAYQIPLFMGIQLHVE